MNTFKTAVVVIVLLGIGYGVWVMINRPPVQSPVADTENLSPPSVETGGGMELVPPRLSDSGAFPPASGSTEAPRFSSFPETGQTGTMGSAPAFPSPSNINPPSGIEPGNMPAVPSVPGVPGVPSQADLSQNNFAGTPGGESRYGAPGVSNAPPVGGTGPAGMSPLDLPQATSATGFASAWDTAQRELERGQLSDALFKLSTYHDDPSLAPQDRQQLLSLLDQLCGTVIYSREYLEPAYVARQGDRLEDIAKQFSVPAQLLANINGIRIDDPLETGDQLKVVRGPFSAIVSTSARELTLEVRGMYAGRFQVDFGTLPQEGQYIISDKMTPGDASNPYGEYWLGLGGGLRIHGESSDMGRDRSIAVSRRDAQDLFAILSMGSSVTITR